MRIEEAQIVVIGAGPAGAVAAALLRRKGHEVLVLERQQFPRFCIGESLLPQCMEFIEEAGMLEAVRGAGFQMKNGAAFARGGDYTWFDFRDKFSPGPSTTFQVPRAQFDKLLADEAARQGVEVRYKQEVVAADFSVKAAPLLTVSDSDSGGRYQVRSRYVLDASGYGRVLARLLNLERPSNLPVRKAIFTHIEDHINEGFDREKILISVHPQKRGIWYWTIPFSNGRCSVGVVGEPELFADRGEDAMVTLRRLISEAPNLQILKNARWDTAANTMLGYSANVTRLYGAGYTLLGNAAEFLDPVFSSGVTIALRSAKLAADVLHRQLSGEAVNWQTEFAAPLQLGVETFRAYVEAWYSGEFQELVFYNKAQPEIRRMISSILAGYAWDTTNPFVAEPGRRLRMLSELCRRDGAEEKNRRDES